MRAMVSGPTRPYPVDSGFADTIAQSGIVVPQLG